MGSHEKKDNGVDRLEDVVDVDIFNALSSMIRIKILSCVLHADTPLTSKKIWEKADTGILYPNVNRHVRELKAAGLLKEVDVEERSGSEKYVCASIEVATAMIRNTLCVLERDVPD